jgi:hypothetical protein
MNFSEDFCFIFFEFVFEFTRIYLNLCKFAGIYVDLWELLLLILHV